MGEIRLFHQVYGQVFRLGSSPFPTEQPLHEQIEKHLLEYLSVCFLAREVPIGGNELDSDEKGRIDTLGIDATGRPVIIEYKRGRNEGVVQQILKYGEWLLKNRPLFRELVRELDQNRAKKVSWQPRLVVVAGEVTDENIRQADRDKSNASIELVRYWRFGDAHLMLEWVYGKGPSGPAPVAVMPMPSAEPAPPPDGPTSSPPNFSKYKNRDWNSNFREYKNWNKARDKLQALFWGLQATLASFGNDVRNPRRMKYIAFKRNRIFANVQFFNRDQYLEVYVQCDPDSVTLEPGFTDDVRNKEHIGPGDLKITIYSRAELEKAKPLLRDSYERS